MIRKKTMWELGLEIANEEKGIGTTAPKTVKQHIREVCARVIQFGVVKKRQ